MESDYPRCGTCKHYQPIDSAPRVRRSADPNWPGWCVLANGPAGEDFENGLPTPTRMAIANDASSYSASLLVTPDFGCVLHEPKDCGCGQ